jgi:hypothetical protein
MSRRWAEIHDFTERQNSRSKIRSNRRSFLLSLPITLFLAVLISLGGWLWLLGGGVLWLLYKILFDNDWTVSSWWRRKKSIGSHSKSAQPQWGPGIGQPPGISDRVFDKLEWWLTKEDIRYMCALLGKADPEFYDEALPPPPKHPPRQTRRDKRCWDQSI